MNAWQKTALWAAGVGGVLLTLMVDSLYQELATGIPTMDRFGLRARVLLYSALGGVDPKVIMALIHNESRGDPANFLGDEGASGGPSVGPGQVYRKTAKDLGLWTPPLEVDSGTERALYAQLADDEDWGVRATVAVFKNKLGIAGGDVAKAIALYNGNPALPQVQTYRDNALAFLSGTFGWVPA